MNVEIAKNNTAKDQLYKHCYIYLEGHWEVY